MRAALRRVRATGFTLLPVILAMGLIAAIAFLLNRDNGLNARMITGQSDLDRARYAAEAGLQAANFVIQGMGCAAKNYPTSSAPVTNSNFFGAAYSAYSTTASGSPLSLVSYGSYNGAWVKLTRDNVYVYQSARQTYPLQPGPASVYDTYLDSGSPTRNFGGASVVRMSTTPNLFQPLLKFDLPTQTSSGSSLFPAGSRAIPWYDSVNSKLQPGAVLSLYQTLVGPSTSDPVYAQLITQSWVEGTETGGSGVTGATWNTYDGNTAHTWPSPGMGYAPVPVASTPYIATSGIWIDWDLTNAVAGWMSGVYPNYGIRLVPSGTTIGNTDYVSSDGAGNRPKLTLNYLLPCGTTGPGAPPTGPTTVTLGAQADTHLEADHTTSNYGADTTMEAGGSGTSPDKRHRMLLRFDVSGIPPNSIVTSATLRLNANQVTSLPNAPKSLDAYALTESFVEGTSQTSGQIYGATWNVRDYAIAWATRGGTYGGSKITGREESSGASPLPGSFSRGWVTWDLTALVQAWVDYPTTNYGFLVKSSDGDQTYTVQFVTKESNQGGGANRPQLVVVYQ